MNNRIHYTNCPVCGSDDLKKVFLAKDYTVSAETFEIMECNSCTLRFTQDVPDAASISSYYKSEDYISHTDTSKGLIGKLYKIARKRTLERKRRLIEREVGVPNRILLDVGSGTGAFVNEMKEHGWLASGLEPDEGARKMAKQLYSLNLLDGKDFFGLPPASYDTITLWHVLEHIHELHKYVQQLKALLKEGGFLFIAVPNYLSLDAKIYKEYWAAYDVPRHLYHFSPQSMKALIEKNGLKLIKQKSMWYDSYYISLLSSKYKNGVSQWVPALWHGLRSNWSAMGDARRCSAVIYMISK